MPLFDTHIVVDWSAKSKPSDATPTKDAIWWAAARDGVVGKPEYARTRHDAMQRLTAIMAGERDAQRRVLVGFDFPFGYPAGVARRLTGQAHAFALWRWLAERIEDDDRNHNNRFDVAARINQEYPGDGPCWGRPVSSECLEIPTHKPDGIARGIHPRERRVADEQAAGAKTVWQLFGAGSVGSQVLLGLPALEQLRGAPTLREQVLVWPFEGGIEVRHKPIVIAEVYPSLLRKAIKALTHPSEIADRAQVRVNAQALASLDAEGGLEPLFGGPSRLEPEQRRQVVEEEGWILGLRFESELQEAARGHSFIGTLRGSVIRYDAPFEPAASASDWSALDDHP